MLSRSGIAKRDLSKNMPRLIAKIGKFRGIGTLDLGRTNSAINEAGHHEAALNFVLDFKNG